MNKKINYLLIAIAIIVGVGYGIQDSFHGDFYGALICFAIIPVMLAPYILKKVFGIKINNQVETIYLIFIFFAHFLGSIIDLYHYLNGYDKVMHFLSGMLSALIGFVLLVKLEEYKRKKLLFTIIFIMAISLSIGALWEFYEFTADNLFGKDAQNVLTTGVDDTMWDMIMAFLGASLVAIRYYYESYRKKRSIVIGFIEEVGGRYESRK